MQILVVHVADDDEDQLIEAIAGAGVRTVVMPCTIRPGETENENVLKSAEILYRTEMATLVPQGRAVKPWDDLCEDDQRRFAVQHTAETAGEHAWCRRPVITAMRVDQIETFLTPETGETE